MGPQPLSSKRVAVPHAGTISKTNGHVDHDRGVWHQVIIEIGKLIYNSKADFTTVPVGYHPT